MFPFDNHADFVPLVAIADYEAELRGHSSGISEVLPQSKYLSNGWTFGRWIDRGEGDVQVRICLFDVVKFTGDIERRIDVSGGSDEGRCVKVQHRLGTETSMSSSGCNADGECRWAADIDFTISSSFAMSTASPAA
jgi:hypothetical protein